MEIVFAEKLEAILPSNGKSVIVTLPIGPIPPEGGMELFLIKLT